MIAWLFMGCGEPAQVEAPQPTKKEEPAPVRRDVTFEMEAHLLYRTESSSAWLPPVRLLLPAYEWQDEEGTFHLELLEGRGTTIGLGPRGEEVPTTLRLRLERFLGDPLVAVEPDGARHYSFRGEVYLYSDRFPLVELEAGATMRVPATDGPWRAAGATVPSIDANIMFALGSFIDAEQAKGLGGAIISERSEPVWGRPAPSLSLYGPFLLVGGDAAPAAMPAAARDADLLLGRLLYVRADYPLAVRDGEVLDPGEYDEQGSILREARLTASRLPLTTDTRERIDALGHAVTDKVSPDTLTAACDDVVARVRRELWLDTAAPDPSRIGEGAALYATHCASCHGAAGEGPPPAAASLWPPPVPLAKAEVASGLSPQRAYSAVTFGVPGTAMVAFSDRLTDAERWALAFHAVRLGAGEPSAPEATPAPDVRPSAAGGRALEDLAWLSNAELGVGARWWRGAGTDELAASPWLAARRHVRAAARDELGAMDRLSAALAALGDARLEGAAEKIRGAAAGEAREAEARALHDLLLEAEQGR